MCIQCFPTHDSSAHMVGNSPADEELFEHKERSTVWKKEDLSI